VATGLWGLSPESGAGLRGQTPESGAYDYM
jgi:hypothetical protein